MSRPVYQYQPTTGKALAERQPHVLEIAAGAVNENERHVLTGCICANFDQVLSQSADIHETPARRMRPPDQHRPDAGDDGADDEDEDDCNTRLHVQQNPCSIRLVREG
ncbi:MAG TPA: hypothetical protein VK825_13245 [Xanthobacteraceae bacterium]|nr:hypothetical protein [Xanthobacteraceae bacterium]